MNQPTTQLIECLDKGYIRYVDHMGSDLSIVRNARVSHSAEWRAGNDSGSDEKLINYLMAHGHNTPFESCVATFEVKAPIFVVRQWHRHRTQSYNEVSARYTELPDDYYVPKVEHIGKQATNNHQQREMDDGEFAERDEHRCLILNHSIKAFSVYKTLLKEGCPRELARAVLPLNTYTRMFATANLHNWYRFIKERTDAGAQYEIKVYAEAILKILGEVYPVATEAFTKTITR